MRYLHENSQTIWEYVNEVTPKFSSITFVNLRNVKTGKIEAFNKSTYLYFFKTI